MIEKTIATLEHLVDTIGRLRSFVEGMEKSEFLAIDEQNLLVFGAVKNCFTEIGEDIIRLPRLIKNRNSQIRWTAIIGMRNIIVHQYEKIELEFLWQTINNGPLEELERMAKIEIDIHKKELGTQSGD